MRMQSLTKPRSLEESVASTTPKSACGVDSITIIVPLYNERDGLSLLYERLVEFHASLDACLNCEFLLIDDGSTDGTSDALGELLVNHRYYRIIKHQTNRGIAAAIRTGLLQANTDCVVSIDSDGSYDLDLLEGILPQFSSGIDIIVASPYHPDGRVENVSAWRIWLSRCASRMYRAIIRQKLYCYTSCFRVYRRQRCVDIVTRDMGFVGVAEFLWLADMAGCKIIEYPAALRPRTVGSSKMKIVQVMLGHLNLMSRIVFSRLLRRTPSYALLTRAAQK